MMRNKANLRRAEWTLATIRKKGDEEKYRLRQQKNKANFPGELPAMLPVFAGNR